MIYFSCKCTQTTRFIIFSELRTQRNTKITFDVLCVLRMYFIELIIRFIIQLVKIHILQKDLNLNHHLRKTHIGHKLEITYCVHLVSKIIKTIGRLTEV